MSLKSLRVYNSLCRQIRLEILIEAALSAFRDELHEAIPDSGVP